MRVTQHVEDLPDPYTSDPLLGRTLDRLLGELGHKRAAGPLEDLATDCSGPLRRAALDAERNPPALRAYDGWGKRVDEIETSPGWDVLRRAAARHGVVALPYEPAARDTWGAGARTVQHALLHLYAPDSAVFSCPVAMSDGAVTVLSEDGVDPELASRLLPRLLSRDPDTAWTSGQWMTETEGGSDVGRATTRAVEDSTGWRLHGEKWFCSATTAEMAVALARPDGAPSGSAGLACFVVPRYAEDADPTGTHPRGRTGLRATSPGLHVHRLKDKLGTHALPSAEVQLDGARAWPVADPREPGGLRRMMALVTVTRLHNAANAAALLRRGVLMARTYAQTREVFGAPLWQQPLHREVLAGLTVEADAAFAITALCFDALGRVEVERDADSAALLRLANSLAKALTAKQSVAGLSEVIECFGGPGYVEDTGVPVLLRDAQVLPVWEGTTTIQSLDVLRAVSDPRVDVMTSYRRRVDSAVDAASSTGSALGATADALARALAAVEADVRAAAAAPA
ncbi:MAG TPA: acyl-CoA dehydrogenase family protein, partial [Mycobacteriales bacterium]|nr:acyl-CoA dehydrogenase family protein [Mycobacteriales bacterium]